ncbi:hypothetical protein N9U75_00860 [Pelagibacteraceae bacterium]|nr:hypothetical protein [Pelagibacteraceae bacterium]
MSLLLKNGYVFFHIPKTGGKFIDQVLVKNNLYLCRIGSRHSNYDHINPIISQSNLTINFKNKKKSINIKLNHPLKFFCVIRDPLSWYESWFKYNSKINFEGGKDKGDYLNWHITSPLTECNNENFNNFMYCVNKSKPGFVTYLFNSYIINTKIQLIRFENFAENLKNFFLENNFNIDYNDLEKSNPVNASEEYSLEWENSIKKQTILNEKNYIDLYYNSYY